MANPVSAVIDTTTLTGTGAAGIGFAATFAQYYPMVTGSLAFIVMVMTIVHLHRRLKNSTLDTERLELDIQIKKDQLKRRATDHNPIED